MSAIGPVNPKIQRIDSLKNQAEAELYYARRQFDLSQVKTARLGDRYISSVWCWQHLFLWAHATYLAEELQAQIHQENTS